MGKLNLRLVKILGVHGLLAAIIAAAVLFAPDQAEAAPLFRIIDVRAEYGHLIVEAQHFNPDSSHWFYEIYTFQGREQYKHPRVTDQLGSSPIIRLFLKNDGRVAPTRVNADGEVEHYLPDGKEWLRHSYPHLDNDSILRVVQKIHGQRLVTGWTRGQVRLTTHPMDFTAEDVLGAPHLLQRFGGLKETAYAASSEGTFLVYVGPLPPVDSYISSAWGTVSTFFPDAHVENTSVDGQVTGTETSSTWANTRDDAGTSADASSATGSFNLDSSSTTNEWDRFRRLIILFDTAALPDGGTISAATMGLVSTQHLNAFGSGISMVTSTPATNTALVGGDYAQTGTTKQASDIADSSWVADSSTSNDFTLNSTGRGNITATGVTKFGIRFAYDADDAEPTWQSATLDRITVATAEEVLSGDRRPVLTVTHTTPAAAITGTIGDGATEQEVRDGTGTIIITLTDATWVAAGGTFDAERQGIIDGLDAAESETNGWNAQVRDQMGVGQAVRTSSTVVTITLLASEVANYRVDSNETITVTVPASAISTSAALTSTPTIAITAAAESVAVTGTLGGSGGTPAEIVAGGETIILTLTNTLWVASGATFNAERQAIINNLASNLSDQNGWDNRRSDFAVGNVVRTSGTVVTITLSASSAYAIPATETVTATAPASGLVYAEALAGTPTFNVVASFQASGNRVTSAIDLSGVTDVAYCAIGWQATTPANTTVTVETSVNGGTSYSSATNGSCPTGITVGATLATVTDFRIRVSLTTTDSTVTPLVTAMALLVQDTSGPALYYQLNTVPGITITDRSANTNAGTMSFPVSTTGINGITGVLESTRATLSAAQVIAVGDVVAPVTGAATSGNIFSQTETGFGSLPFQDIISTMATGAEVPTRFLWVLFIGLFSIALGALALHFTGSLMIAAVGMGAGLSLGAAIGAGLIPGWTVMLFIVLALSLIILRARGALPL